MKSIQAWAILENGKLALYDHRLPITWTYITAVRERVAMCDDDAQIVRVEIKPVRAKRKAKR